MSKYCTVCKVAQIYVRFFLKPQVNGRARFTNDAKI
nr:MAG TPA: hypothetical protein [Caudoviricetes sp.]